MTEETTITAMDGEPKVNRTIASTIAKTETRITAVTDTAEKITRQNIDESWGSPRDYYRGHSGNVQHTV